jgi:hypothetical protein
MHAPWLGIVGRAMSLKIKDLPNDVQRHLAEIETTIGAHETFIAGAMKTVYGMHRNLKHLAEEMDKDARRAKSRIRILLHKIHKIYPSFAENPGDLAPFENWGDAGTVYFGRESLPSAEIDPVHRESLKEIVDEVLAAEQTLRDEVT